MASSVVLITGALTGIGRATAFAFARIGAQLVVSGRHDETGRSLAGELREAGAEAEFVRADVRVEDEVRVPTARPRVSGASTSPSTTPARKAGRAR